MRFAANTFLGLVIVGTFGYSAYMFTKPPCGSPLQYSIGQFDQKFGITREGFVSALAEAEKIWEDSVGKDLFEYDALAIDSRADFIVNLIYDERQALADRNEILESHIEQTAETAEGIKRQFEALKARLESEKAAYETALKQYEKRHNAYNSEVSAWNTKGGAPAGVYENLTREKAALSTMRTELETKRLAVNALADEVNAQIDEYNRLVRIENVSIDEINTSAEKEFEQGEYVSDREGQRINMYEFTSRTELVRTLAHEFGHAIGLDHNSNPESIMYYLNKKDGLVLSVEDITSLKTQCEME